MTRGLAEGDGEERWVETLQTSYLVHGEVGEQDDKVLLHSDDEAGVALVSPGDHLHVVAHPEIFSHLVSRELQRVLHGAHTGQRAGQREYVQLHQIMLRYSKSRPLYSCAMRRRGSERITNQKVKVMTPVSCVQDCVRTFRSSCLGMMVILLPSTLRIFPCRLISSPSHTSTLSPACRLCSRSLPERTHRFKLKLRRKHEFMFST